MHIEGFRLTGKIRLAIWLQWLRKLSLACTPPWWFVLFSHLDSVDIYSWLQRPKTWQNYWKIWIKTPISKNTDHKSSSNCANSLNFIRMWNSYVKHWHFNLFHQLFHFRFKFDWIAVVLKNVPPCVNQYSWVCSYGVWSQWRAQCYWSKWRLKLSILFLFVWWVWCHFKCVWFQSYSKVDAMRILVMGIEVFCAFGFVFFSCEFGERLSGAFDDVSNCVGHFNWYNFPIVVQRMMPTVLMTTQQKIALECFGSILCVRKALKSVSQIKLNDFDQ